MKDRSDVGGSSGECNESDSTSFEGVEDVPLRNSGRFMRTPNMTNKRVDFPLLHI